MRDPENEENENLGRRIADHRAKLGLTQQELADRVGISRVAVSHLEAGKGDPGERTVALMAGLFKVEPWELVAGTSYPAAKVDRLPIVAARYTEVEHELLLLDADLRWLEVVPGESARVVAEWSTRLAALLDVTHDRRERSAVTEALAVLRARAGRCWPPAAT